MVTPDGVPLTDAELARRKRTCADCGAALWQADRRGPRRYPLADYVKQRLNGWFDLLIADEVHEYKGRGSAQGIAAGILADVCGTSLALTGTLAGGYASTLFHLLYRFSPALRAEFEHGEEARWIARYGFVEHTVRRPADEALEDGRHSRRRRYRTVIRERPGLAPAALFHLIGHTVFLRLADVASGLPPYTEQVRLVDLADGSDETGYSQQSAYQAVFTTLRKALADALAHGSKRLLGAYLQTLLAYPDGCTRGETVFDPQTQQPLVQVPPLAEDRVYPKEQALLDLVAAEQQAGRRVLVYVTHTGTRDITGRLHALLTRHGARVAVLKADAVKPDRREAWVAERVPGGLDVLVCHPRLVQTGLDLLDFATVCWYETDYSVYTLRQASRRSWRIGQTQPVQVVYLAYRQTLQAAALTLVAKKLQSSLAVEGELPEDGLAAYGDDGDDLLLALARQIVSGEEADAAEPVEAVFAQAQAAAADAEALLVDEGLAAGGRAEPVVVEVPATGANGRATTPTGRVDQSGQRQRVGTTYRPGAAAGAVDLVGRVPGPGAGAVQAQAPQAATGCPAALRVAGGPRAASGVGQHGTLTAPVLGRPSHWQRWPPRPTPICGLLAFKPRLLGSNPAETASQTGRFLPGTICLLREYPRAHPPH